MAAFVYIMDLGFDGLYKIGRSRNPVEHLSALRIGNPKVALLAMRRVRNSEYSEAQLHKRHKAKLVRNEVFKFSPEEAARALEGDIEGRRAKHGPRLVGSFRKIRVGKWMVKDQIGETAAHIIWLREKHNLSQGAMAKHLGCSQRAVAKYEAGVARPKSYRLYARWVKGDEIAGEVLAEEMPEFARLQRELRGER